MTITDVLRKSGADALYTPQALVAINAKSMGAKGDATLTGSAGTDDTTALQNAINLAVASNRPLYLPNGVYKTTAELVINGPITVFGDGVDAKWDSVAAADFSSYYCYTDLGRGSVIRPSTAAQNGIRITGVGNTVHLRDFGIRFADAIKFANTGHGIKVDPPINAYDGVSQDHGTFNSHWQRLKVFGHDGNHYAYDITNPLDCKFEKLSAVGGGTLRLWSRSSLFYYGNSVIDTLYGAVIQSGTADGINLGGTGSGSGGSVQLLHWIRPQIWVADAHSNVAGTTAPAGASQYNLRADPATSRRMSWDSPDFESNVSALTQFPILRNFVTDGGQVTGYASGNALPTTTLSNNTAYQNTTGYPLLMSAQWQHNPTSTVASTVDIYVGPNTDATGGAHPVHVLVPAAGPTNVPSSTAVVIPPGYYFKVSTVQTAYSYCAYQRLTSYQ